MVGAELHLEAIGRLGLGTHHDPGVVDQDVHGVLLLVEGGRALPDRFQGGQVQLKGLHHLASRIHFDVLDGFVGFLHVTTENDDTGSSFRQLTGGDLANASVCP